MSGFVDVHPHVISRDAARYPPAPLGRKQSDWSQERPVSAEEMLAAMDAAGIERSVLVQASSCYGHDNSYLADSVAAHPQRFSGVFSVDVLAGDALQRIKHWKARGLIGLRVFVAGHTVAQDVRLDDPRSFAAWECAQAEGLPVCVQMRAPGLAQLDAMLKRFPKARVALDHMARPAHGDLGRLCELAKHENLVLKLTTHNVHDLPAEFLERAVMFFGARRVAWGSNYPAAKGRLAELLAQARKALAGLTAEQRDWVFSRTAASLYPAK